MNFLLIGALSAGLSVAFGAFAAHGLKEALSSYSLDIFETAAQYQMYHALALIVVALLCLQRGASKLLTASGWLFVFGSVVFSGSLYALALTGIGVLGAITPIGGVGFLVGWGCLCAYAVIEMTKE